MTTAMTAAIHGTTSSTVNNVQSHLHRGS